MQSGDKIAKARITVFPKTFSDPLPEVWITLENGQEEKLFDYYPDEITFETEEFIGLTIAQALRLKVDKDRGYLRS